MTCIRPALDAAAIGTAVRLLVTNPGSLVTSTGPQWVLQRTAEERVSSAAVAFLLTDADGHDVGVVLVRKMQTPGHFRVEIVSGDDERFGPDMVADAMFGVVEFLASSADVARLDLTFGVYNDLLLRWALDSESFRFEGIIRNAFFAAGRYWDGVLLGLTGTELADFRETCAITHDAACVDLAARLTARITADLSVYTPGTAS